MRTLVLACALAGLAAADRQLLPNGGFAAGTDGWELSHGAAPATDPANRFLHLEADPGRMVSAYRSVAVGDAKALRLDFRARWNGVKRGGAAWHDARIMLDFTDAAGKKLKGAPGAPYFTGSSQGWQSRSLVFAVPEGAANLTLLPCLFQAAAGTFDLDDLALTPVDASALPPPPAPRPEPVVDGGGRPPQALHVDGNRLLRADGTEAWLQGVSVDSLQWSNAGESTVASVIAAIEVWKANVVRLPMSGKRWFGQTEGQSDNGAAYRAVIAQAVKAASSRGAWLILDLHRFGAPEEADVAFWKDAAAVYKDDPAVIYELFNEPHDIPWAVWRDGGDVDGGRKAGVVAENAEQLARRTSTGMQALVDAVRGTGAGNLVLAGGLDYAYDISGILQGFALDSRGGNGLAYVTHVYPWKSSWQEKFLETAKIHPVVMTEVGCDQVRYDFIPAERFEDPYGWAPDMIACIQRNRIHWTAFSFHPRCGPPMLADTETFAPTPFWGAFVRAALAGAQYRSERMR